MYIYITDIHIPSVWILQPDLYTIHPGKGKSEKGDWPPVNGAKTVAEVEAAPGMWFMIFRWETLVLSCFFKLFNLIRWRFRSVVGYNNIYDTYMIWGWLKTIYRTFTAILT